MCCCCCFFFLLFFQQNFTQGGGKKRERESKLSVKGIKVFLNKKMAKLPYFEEKKSEVTKF
jgi:hypothetical protein